jgi:hypothetical protein
LTIVTPRLNAYILAADPAWVEKSIQSYYGLVQRIVVSYDKSGRSWTGKPLPVDDCLARLASVDSHGKLDWRPGDYARSGHDPLENETYQRQHALQQASDGADWVIQLDTDEVISNPDLFNESLMAADAGGYDALVYPARNLYQRTNAGLFLEHSSRLWRCLASYPGPVAVRSGVELHLCRQGGTNLYVVGFADGTLPLYFMPPVPVRRVISFNDAILHFSWIRSDDEMALKVTTFGHAHNFDWSSRLRRWRRAGRHPLLTAAMTPLKADKRDRLRISRIPGWER